MFKIIIKVTLVLLIVFSASHAKAQGHITGGDAGCRLKGTWAREGMRVCPACKKIVDAEYAAKKAADAQAYREEQLRNERDLAAKKAADDAWRKKQTEAREAEQKKTKVLVLGNQGSSRPANASGNSTGSRSNSSDNDNSSTNSYPEAPARPVPAYNKPLAQPSGGPITTLENITIGYAQRKAAEDRANAQAAYNMKMAIERADREAAEAEAARKKRVSDLFMGRTRLLSDTRGGQVPLSSKRIPETVIYFFAFSKEDFPYNAATAYLNVTDVFPVAKRADGTWPFTDNLLTDLVKANNGQGVELAGYYTTKEEAVNKRYDFISQLNNLDVSTRTINYKGKPATTNTTGVDAWGNPTAPAATESKAGAATDFWGNATTQPTKAAEPAPEAKTAATTDFWGNPVKTEATPARKIVKKPVKKTGN